MSAKPQHPVSLRMLLDNAELQSNFPADFVVKMLVFQLTVLAVERFMPQWSVQDQVLS